MDVRENLSQMVTGQAPATEDGMPARGSEIELDGAACIVTSSARVAGQVWVYGVDVNGTTHQGRL